MELVAKHTVQFALCTAMLYEAAQETHPEFDPNRITFAGVKYNYGLHHPDLPSCSIGPAWLTMELGGLVAIKASHRGLKHWLLASQTSNELVWFAVQVAKARI